MDGEIPPGRQVSDGNQIEAVHARRSHNIVELLVRSLIVPVPPNVSSLPVFSLLSIVTRSNSQTNRSVIVGTTPKLHNGNSSGNVGVEGGGSAREQKIYMNMQVFNVRLLIMNVSYEGVIKYSLRSEVKVKLSPPLPSRNARKAPAAGKTKATGKEQEAAYYCREITTDDRMRRKICEVGCNYRREIAGAGGGSQSTQPSRSVDLPVYSYAVIDCFIHAPGCMTESDFVDRAEYATVNVYAGECEVEVRAVVG